MLALLATFQGRSGDAANRVAGSVGLEGADFRLWRSQGSTFLLGPVVEAGLEMLHHARRLLIVSLIVKSVMLC